MLGIRRCFASSRNYRDIWPFRLFRILHRFLFFLLTLRDFLSRLLLPVVQILIPLGNSGFRFRVGFCNPKMKKKSFWRAMLCSVDWINLEGELMKVIRDFLRRLKMNDRWLEWLKSIREWRVFRKIGSYESNKSRVEILIIKNERDVMKINWQYVKCSGLLLN